MMAYSLEVFGFQKSVWLSKGPNILKGIQEKDTI